MAAFHTAVLLKILIPSFFFVNIHLPSSHILYTWFHLCRQLLAFTPSPTTEFTMHTDNV